MWFSLYVIITKAIIKTKDKNFFSEISSNYNWFVMIISFINDFVKISNGIQNPFIFIFIKKSFLGFLLICF